MHQGLRCVAGVLAIALAGRLFGDGPPCDPTTHELPLDDTTVLTGISGTFSYDAIALAMLNSPGVTQTRSCDVGGVTEQCLFVPKYPGSDACGAFHLEKCFDASHPAGPNEFCLVTDEFSQLGLILAMATDPAAVTAFGRWMNTVRALSAFTAINELPAWNARVQLDGAGKATIDPWNFDDASDATARIVLALYVAAFSPQHASNRAVYEGLANRLANRFAHFDVRDTRNAYGGGRFWLAAGKNAAANAVTNTNPFTYTGYFGDVALAMIAAYRATGESRYASLASDAIANYLQAAGFTTSFAVPPVKFSWSLTTLPPTAVAREDLSDHWDDADAPRAVSICKAAYFAGIGQVPIDPATQASLTSYCDRWMQSDGVLNGAAEYQRQYYLNGARFGLRSLHYWNVGLGASLNFLLCPADLRRRLDAAAAKYDTTAKVFQRDNGQNESCLGVYSHAFFITNFGSAIGRDFGAYQSEVLTPQELTVLPSGTSYTLSWVGSSGAAYEIARGCNAETFSVVRSGQTSTSWTDDTALVPGAAYLYKVRAVVDGKRSRFTPPASIPETPVDAATPRVSRIRADDVRQVRDGVNRLLAAAGLAAINYTPITPGVDRIKASHFADLQTDVNRARQAVGRGSFSFSAVSPNQAISAKVINELRDAVRACPDANLTQASE